MGFEIGISRKIKFYFKINEHVFLKIFLKTYLYRNLKNGQAWLRGRFYFVNFFPRKNFSPPMGMSQGEDLHSPYFYLWTKLHFCILPRYDLFRIDASYVKECVAALNNKNSFEAQQKSIQMISYDSLWCCICTVKRIPV